MQASLDDAWKQRDDAKKELSELKEEYSNKMSNIKLLEMELEEKLQNARENEDDEWNFNSKIENWAREFLYSTFSMHYYASVFWNLLN